MNIIKINKVMMLAALIGIAGSMLAFNTSVRAQSEIESPVLPNGCNAIKAPEDTKLLFRTYATGTQNYRWNGTDWEFVAPSADLFASPNFNGHVGTHYAGPTWESNNGSRVVAARLQSCTPDASAIPWLLLETVSTSGRGVFRNVTHIQRVGTMGGLKPSQPGSVVGEEARVPYTAVYYFYRGGLILNQR